MPYNDLPLEIVEDIISSFMDEPGDAPRRVQLSLCSLVCQSWRSIAQPLLFSRVIMDTQKPNRFQKLMDYPHLRTYVSAFWIEGSLIKANQCREFSEVAPLLPPLKQLRFHTKGNYDRQPPHAKVLAVLPGMLASDRLTSLSFLDMTLPLDMFFHCKALQELDIRECRFTGIPMPTTTFLDDSNSELPHSAALPPISAPRIRPQLERLSVFATRAEEVEILHWFSQPDCHLDLSQMSILLVSERSDDIVGHDVLCKFLEAVSPAIKNVCLDPGSGCSNIPRTSFIPQFPRLTDLRVVSFGLRENFFGRNNPLPWVIDFLENLPSPQTLEEIYFHGSLESEIVRSEEDLRDQGWPADWARFDKLLLSSRFSHIGLVTFCLYDHGADAEALYAHLRRSLPGLSNAGRLVTSIPDVSSIPMNERHWQTLRSGPWRYGVGL